RGRVNAIALAGRGRAVVKNVTQMRVALAAADFGPFHAERAIRFLGNVLVVDWLGKAGPAAAAVEFIERREKRLPADNIDINSGAMIIPILVAKRRFGAALLGHVILLRRELLFQLLGRRLGRSLIGGG